MPIKLVRRSVRAGFTLIELLAVIVIIGILATFLLPKIPEAIDAAEVTSCKQNMSNIYGGLMIYRTKYERVPRKSGARFFTSLIEEGVWECDASTAKKLTCPAVLPDSLLGLQGQEPDQWYADGDAIDGSFSAYAGLNVKEYPLRGFPPKNAGKTVLVADDNDGGANHMTATVVLFANGSASTYELHTERDKGNVMQEEQFIIVGPESRIGALQKLSLD